MLQAVANDLACRNQDLAELCSALHADEKNKFDEVVNEKGVRILIEPNALMHVLGTTMDYVEDRIKCAASSESNSQLCSFISCALTHTFQYRYSVGNIFSRLRTGGRNAQGFNLCVHGCRSEFTFHNPNSKGECGCGESFTV